MKKKYKTVPCPDCNDTSFTKDDRLCECKDTLQLAEVEPTETGLGLLINDLGWKKIKIKKEEVGDGYLMRSYYSLFSSSDLIIAHIFSNGFSNEEFEANAELLFSAPIQQAEIKKLEVKLTKANQIAHDHWITSGIYFAHVDQLRGLLMATSGPKSLMSDALRNQVRAILAETEVKS